MWKILYFRKLGPNSYFPMFNKEMHIHEKQERSQLSMNNFIRVEMFL